MGTKNTSRKENMSEAKFSTDEWKLNSGMSDWGLPKQHDIFIGEGKNDRDQIAGVPSITPYCMGSKQADRDYAERQWGNAVLISAAPQLYNALQGFMESLFGGDEKTVVVDHERLLILRSVAAIALTKARGEDRK
jgi:hypothetical protein